MMLSSFSLSKPQQYCRCCWTFTALHRVCRTVEIHLPDGRSHYYGLRGIAGHAVMAHLCRFAFVHDLTVLMVYTMQFGSTCVHNSFLAAAIQ
uniref:Uncharacterized protein n=1 Tax=Anguilla anguilla TaxID=7936 RepID=A0A0E9WK89_ANGAN